MVCKTTQAGATPARDSILSGIGVERHTPVFQTGVRGAIPRCPSISQVKLARRQRPRTVEVMAGRRLQCAWDSISCDAKTGAGQDFTGLTAAVQLRLRVASGLQTLTVKSRLLTGENSVRIRGDPPFHAGVAQQRQQQFRKLPGSAPHESAILSVGPSMLP